MGLIDQAQGKSPAGVKPPAPGAMPPAAGPGAKPGVDRAQSEKRIVMAAMKALYDPQTGPKIMGMVKAAKDPAQGLAQATIVLLTEFVKIANGTMRAELIVPAAKYILILIAEMADAAGLTQGPEVVGAAMKLLMVQIKEAVSPGKGAPGQEQPPPTTQPVAQAAL